MKNNISEKKATKYMSKVIKEYFTEYPRSALRIIVAEKLHNHKLGYYSLAHNSFEKIIIKDKHYQIYKHYSEWSINNQTQMMDILMKVKWLDIIKVPNDKLPKDIQVDNLQNIYYISRKRYESKDLF